jgi:Ras-related protein Rab-6A
MHTFTNNIIVDESGSASQIENYKIVIIGDQHVGKTSILSKYKYETIEENYAPTIGIDFLTKNVFLEDKTIRLIMWDTAGQERFKSLIPSYLKNANSIILTFDITSKNSFNSLNKWLEDIKNHVQDGVFIVLCGNKIDLNNKRQVSFEDAKKFAKDKDLIYVETSAITGDGIKNLFDIITKSFYDGGVSIGNDSQINEKSIVLQSNNHVVEEVNNKKICCMNNKKKEKKK